MSPDSDFENSKCHVVHILNYSVLDIYQIMRINLKKDWVKYIFHFIYEKEKKRL